MNTKLWITILTGALASDDNYYERELHEVWLEYLLNGGEV